ncbi:MAG TPA: prolyl oligopeptidase family serine peptidase [Flavobacteriaceae bacterium]|nr:prolyl oligopeptidase family serine peptidase [Flavobacteriaceae bacterium]
MKDKILLFLIISFLPIHFFGQTNGEILSTDKVTFPLYNEIKNISEYCSKDEYEAAINDKDISFEKITYYSDSLKVKAYYIKPIHNSNENSPIIIFNRGGLIRNDIGYVYASLFKKFIDNGFVVIAPALRGSEGGEGKDENGGKDLDDIMNILPLLKNLKSIDISDIFMLGESRGGYMTFLAARKNFPMRAIATVGAITDMELYLKNNPSIEAVAEQIWPDFKSNRSQILDERSAIKWADKINTPTLIMHGNNDQSVNPIHSLNLAEKFQSLGKEYELVIINKGNHILSGSSSNQRNETIIKWFKQHL